MRAIVPVSKSDDGVTFVVSYDRYRPFLVSIEHVAADAGCTMTAEAMIAPQVKYFAEPVAFRGSIRMTLPAARLDRLTFTVRPARCAGQTFYRIRRVEEATVMPAAARQTTELFSRLMAVRKNAPSDELFDIRSDPAMLQNLAGRIDTVPYADGSRALYKKAASRPQPEHRITPEELQRLRSLGYIQ